MNKRIRKGSLADILITYRHDLIQGLIIFLVVGYVAVSCINVIASYDGGTIANWNFWKLIVDMDKIIR